MTVSVIDVRAEKELIPWTVISRDTYNSA